MLAISYVVGEQTFIKVLSCQDNKVEDMFKNLEDKKFEYEFKTPTKFIRKLVFDITDNRYLIGYGDTKVLIMRLSKDMETADNPSHEVLCIETNYFEKIYHLRF